MVASAELKSILNHQDFEKWRFPEMGKRCPQIVHFKKGASMKTIHFFGYHHDGNSGTCGFGCSKGECGTGITMARNSPPRVPRVFSSERPEMLRLLPGNKSEVNPTTKCYNWFKIEYSPEKRKNNLNWAKTYRNDILDIHFITEMFFVPTHRMCLEVSQALLVCFMAEFLITVARKSPCFVG